MTTEQIDDGVQVVVHSLAAEYADVPAATVVHIVSTALQSVDLFGPLDGDRVALVERIARQDLDFISGGQREVARLDPQPRPSRRPR